VTPPHSPAGFVRREEDREETKMRRRKGKERLREERSGRWDKDEVGNGEMKKGWKNLEERVRFFYRLIVQLILATDL